MLEIWVKNLKTNQCWKMDEDSSKPVYMKDGQTMFKDSTLSKIGCFRFYPCDPGRAESIRDERCHQQEMETEGYQYSLFDYMES